MPHPTRSRLVSSLSCLLALACSEPSQPPASAPEAGPTGQAAPTAAQAPAPSPPPGLPKPPPPEYPRGLVASDSAATPGYVLFNPLLSDTAYLVDGDGAVVHTWKTPYSPGGAMYLLPDGHLLRTGRDPALTAFRAGGTGGILQEIDWDGRVVWEWRFSDSAHVQHHDIEPMPDGNILVLAWEVKSADEARRAGRRPDQIPEQGLWPDWLLEIAPDRAAGTGAEVVWEWHVWDHLVQNHAPEAANFGDPAAQPGRLDLNAGTHAEKISPEELAQLQALGYVAPGATASDLQSDFLHTNAVAYHPRLDQIALSVPSLGEVWIIDHAIGAEQARGPAGDLLYRWGNPATYGRGAADGQRLFYQHDVRWIPDGWQGAGNLSIFNNGRDRPEGPWSSVDEWTPPLLPNGRYALAEAQPYGPEALAWRYTADEPTRFFAPFISGAHRTPNGNTMICDGTRGRLFEVTREGRVVWDYRNPFSGHVRNEDGSMPQPGLEDSPYAVFRATRIPADHPGIAGRRLEPLDPQPAWHEPGRTGASRPAPRRSSNPSDLLELSGREREAIKGDQNG